MTTITSTHKYKDFTISTHDPYGFVKVNSEEGQNPKEFEGVFTSPSDAHKAVDGYLAKRDLKEQSKGSVAKVHYDKLVNPAPVKEKKVLI